MNNDNNPPKDPMDQFMPMDKGSNTMPTQPLTPAPSDPVVMPSPGVPPVTDPVMPSFSQPDPAVGTNQNQQAADPVSFNVTQPAAQQDVSSSPMEMPTASNANNVPAAADSTSVDTQPATGDPVMDELHKIENKLEEMDEKL